MMVCVPAELANQLPRLDDLLRIEARRRLVEDEHIGVVKDRLRQADALPVALRELAAMAVGHVGDPRPLHRRRRRATAISRRGTPLMRATNSRYSRTVMSG